MALLGIILLLLVFLFLFILVLREFNRERQCRNNPSSTERKVNDHNE